MRRRDLRTLLASCRSGARPRAGTARGDRQPTTAGAGACARRRRCWCSCPTCIRWPAITAWRSDYALARTPAARASRQRQGAHRAPAHIQRRCRRCWPASTACCRCRAFHSAADRVRRAVELSEPAGPGPRLPRRGQPRRSRLSAHVAVARPGADLPGAFRRSRADVHARCSARPRSRRATGCRGAAGRPRSATTWTRSARSCGAAGNAEDIALLGFALHKELDDLGDMRKHGRRWSRRAGPSARAGLRHRADHRLFDALVVSRREPSHARAGRRCGAPPDLHRGHASFRNDAAGADAGRPSARCGAWASCTTSPARCARPPTTIARA